MVKKRIAVTGFGRVKLGPELGVTAINYEHGLIRGQIFRRCNPDSLDRDDIEKELNNPENISLDRLKQYFSTPKRSFEHITAEILKNADVLGEPYPLGCDFSNVPKKYAPHQKVMNALSKEEKSEAENVAGNNWDIIVALNYVRKNFPIYSQEFYAAVWRYYYFVEEDDYKVGYLASEMGWRFSHEKDALEAKARKSASGKGSAKANANKKAQRIEALLLEMEKLFSQNPGAASFGEGAIAKAALKMAVKDDPPLWSQGQGQLENYLVEIRTNPELKPRYLKMFP